MALDLSSNLSIGKSTSFLQAAFLLCWHLVLDFVGYGLIVPLVGIYLGGGCANLLGFPPKYELFLIVCSTFLLMYGTVYVIGETTYWKKLFAFDSCYTHFLEFRDLFNVALLVTCIISLSKTVEVMIVEDEGMKERYISERVGYFVLVTVFGKDFADSHLTLFGWNPSQGLSFSENKKIAHSSLYVLYWAMIASCVAKLVYFNTLFTYLKAMEIFISMKPAFDDEVECRDTISRGRLENNFPQPVCGLNGNGTTKDD